MPWTPLYFRLSLFLIARRRQENGFRDATALDMRKTRVRVSSEMKVRIEDRSAPRQIRLSIPLRSGCGCGDYDWRNILRCMASSVCTA